MRIVAFSDWRSQPMVDIDWALDSIDEKPDLIVYAGDDTRRFGEVPFEQILADEIEGAQGTVLPAILPAARRPAPFVIGSRGGWSTLAVRLREAAGAPLETVNRVVLSALRRRDSDPASWGPPTPAERLCRLLGDPATVGALREALARECSLTQVTRGSHRYAVFSLRPGQQEARPNEFERLARRASKGLAGVIGNDCAPWHRHIFRAPGVRDLHRRPLRLGRFGIIGLEASPGPMGIVTYTEKDATRHLREQAERFPAATPLIIVSHAPPHGVLDLALRFGVGRIGSRALRAFIKRHDVRLVICGHAHLGGGQLARLGDCWVVNASNHDGPDDPGRVAVIDIEGGAVQRVEWVLPHTLKVTALVQCGPKRTQFLDQAGILTRKDVLDVSDEHLAQAARAPLKIAQLWQTHARALQQKRFLPCSWPFQPKSYPRNAIYYDIETLPLFMGEQVWLIGVLMPGTRRVVQFLAKRPGEERAILTRFMELIESEPAATLVCYSGNGFDHRYIADRLQRKLPSHAARFEAREKIDLLNYLRQQVVPPSAGFKLKAVAQAAGIPMRHPSLGILLAAEYLESIQRRRAWPGSKWRIALQYNEDDVLAMPRLLQRVYLDLMSDDGQPGTDDSLRALDFYRAQSLRGLAQALAEWGPSWATMPSPATTEAGREDASVQLR
ncbi:ribonuclease H-like domain-containing protein [Corallococcus terminator]